MEGIDYSHNSTNAVLYAPSNSIRVPLVRNQQRGRLRLRLITYILDIKRVPHQCAHLPLDIQCAYPTPARDFRRRGGGGAFTNRALSMAHGSIPLSTPLKDSTRGARNLFPPFHPRLRFKPILSLSACESKSLECRSDLSSILRFSAFVRR